MNKNKRYKGDILFITAGKENKGASGYIGNDCEIFEKCISVDMFGNCFYHDERCSGDDNVYFFVNEQLSELEKQFIATSIDTYLGNSFSYAEQFRQTNADQLFVYLPATSDGDPDWKWMESYMQSQMEKASWLADHLDRLLA